MGSLPIYIRETLNPQDIKEISYILYACGSTTYVNSSNIKVLTMDGRAKSIDLDVGIEWKGIIVVDVVASKG